MELHEYTIVYHPFPMSDATAEAQETGKDEDDARARFEKRYPLWRIKEIKEK
jgi:hypothetical protein